MVLQGLVLETTDKIKTTGKNYKRTAMRVRGPVGTGAMLRKQ